MYFRYGAMGSGKTAALLQVAYNYEQKNMKVILIKPSIDTREILKWLVVLVYQEK